MLYVVVLQIVDMRWGIREEAEDDHTTTETCLKEIEACQKLSTGPNFVVRNDNAMYMYTEAGLTSFVTFWLFEKNRKDCSFRNKSKLHIYRHL